MTLDFAKLKAELPRVISGCKNPERAKAEYDAAMAYFESLR
jgi:hypothetical protein